MSTSTIPRPATETIEYRGWRITMRQRHSDGRFTATLTKPDGGTDTLGVWLSTEINAVGSAKSAIDRVIAEGGRP